MSTCRAGQGLTQILRTDMLWGQRCQLSLPFELSNGWLGHQQKVSVSAKAERYFRKLPLAVAPAHVHGRIGRFVETKNTMLHRIQNEWVFFLVSSADEVRGVLMCPWIPFLLILLIYGALRSPNSSIPSYEWGQKKTHNLLLVDSRVEARSQRV